MQPLDHNEEDPIRLWAEIWKLRSELEGPKGFETWKDAALHERLQRIALERKLRDSAFDEAWKEKEAAGYQYGEGALEHVRFGWNMLRQKMIG